MKNLLIERIENKIEEKAMKYGLMGTEPVTVILELTNEERESFYTIEKYDEINYSWDLEGNELTITYQEEV